MMVSYTAFIDYLRYEKRVSHHTVVSYETDLAQFFHYIEQIDPNIAINEIEMSMVRTWIVSLLENEIMPQTIRRKISALKSLFKYYLKIDLIKVNPMQAITVPKVSKRLPLFVAKDEIETLFTSELFEDNYEGWRDRAVLELFYATGIRLSELIHLTFGDIDFYNDTIKVLGKRNKERIIPFGETLKLILKKYFSLYKKKISTSNENSYIFVTSKQNKLNPKIIYRIVRKYLDMITTIDKRSPHVMRHTIATHLLNNGADINAVKEILGHSSLAATQIYTHNSIEKLKSIYKQAHPRA